MTILIGLLCLALFIVIVVQIGKIVELSAKIRGEEVAERESNDWTARLMLVFMPLFLIGCFVSFAYYTPYMLGYGPNVSASIHGEALDDLFNITMIVTVIVFVLTHILLFWYAYKYRQIPGQKAEFISHNNTIEIVWTVIPAVTMCYLVISGLFVWNDVMADIGEGEEVIEVEATGYQFAWDLRHPGKDGLLGTKNFRLISGANPVGQDWTDAKNIDDILIPNLVLPKGKKVRVRITAKDVLHNFYLPHFRVKMDAIPGLPTYFVFTPRYTTAEYRLKLRDSGVAMWMEPADPTEPDGLKKWEAFEYELACAELCGSGHYSMKKVLTVVEPAEYDKWLNEQEPNSYYLTNIRGTDEDPFKGQSLAIEKRLEAAASAK